MSDENQHSPGAKTFAARTGDALDDTLRTFLIAALIAIGIRSFAFEPFNIPSSSMVPNLLIGDYLFVSKYSYGYSSKSSLFGLVPLEGRLFGSEPKRGDVIVFKLPSDEHTDYIKRLIGLPGDTVQMRHGLLYINGVPLDRRALAEPEANAYLTPPSWSHDYEELLPEGVRHIIREEGDDRTLDDTPAFQVPKGHYFFMGDNRDNSQDSRTPMVGFVPADNLVGRAEVIFFSLDEGAAFWQFWKWPFSIRWGRLMQKIK